MLESTATCPGGAGPSRKARDSSWEAWGEAAPVSCIPKPARNDAQSPAIPEHLQSPVCFGSLSEHVRVGTALGGHLAQPRLHREEEICLLGGNSAFPPFNTASSFHLGVLQKTLGFFPPEDTSCPLTSGGNCKEEGMRYVCVRVLKDCIRLSSPAPLQRQPLGAGGDTCAPLSCCPDSP